MGLPFSPIRAEEVRVTVLLFPASIPPPRLLAVLFAHRSLDHRVGADTKSDVPAVPARRIIAHDDAALKAWVKLCCCPARCPRHCDPPIAAHMACYSRSTTCSSPIQIPPPWLFVARLPATCAPLSTVRVPSVTQSPPPFWVAVLPSVPAPPIDEPESRVKTPNLARTPPPQAPALLPVTCPFTTRLSLST